MLMKIGPVICDLTFNIDHVGRETKRDFVEKPLVGARPPLEDVGPGTETLSVSGRLLPGRLGGLPRLDALRRAQETGEPQLVVRGDGTVFGFYTLDRISDEHSYLDADGVGQVVDITIDMRRAGAPAASDVFGSLFSLF